MAQHRKPLVAPPRCVWKKMAWFVLLWTARVLTTVGLAALFKVLILGAVAA